MFRVHLREFAHYFLLFFLTPRFLFAAGNTRTGATGAELQNPIFTSSITELVAKLLSVVVTILLPIAVLFLVWAGFKFVTAGGNQEKVKDARNMFLWTVLGIVLILGAKLLGDILNNTLSSITITG